MNKGSMGKKKAGAESSSRRKPATRQRQHAPAQTSRARFSAMIFRAREQIHQ
jgi:hypothetical protein